jgi:phosphate transport system permease protein
LTEAPRLFKDRLARRLILALIVTVNVIIVGLVLTLYARSQPIFKSVPLGQLLFSTEWHPAQGQFGLLTFIVGTFAVTAGAVVLAVPPCLLAAIYLSEYAPRLVGSLAAPLVDLLAGIPSVIYGLWGVLVIVPLIQERIGPLCGARTTGYSVLAAAAVLAVMIVPVLVHVSVEVMRGVPRELREASLALGATRWQTVKHVVLRKSRPGLFAAGVLATSRALGETMAVLMVAGNYAFALPKSPFDPAYPLPVLIANNYGEMLSLPHYEAALMAAALVLLLIVLVFNVTSQAILVRFARS